MTLAEVHEVWPAALETIEADYALLAAALGNARAVDLTDGALVVAFAPDDTLQPPDGRREPGSPPRARRGAARAHRARGCASSTSCATSASREAPPELAGDELVARFVQEFDAEEIVPEPEPQGPA